MIALVEGTVAERGASRVVVLAGGVGYELQVSASTLAGLPPTGQRARVLTHLHVRDDVYLPHHKIDALALRPVGRLSGPQYARVQEVFSIARPKWGD